MCARPLLALLLVASIAAGPGRASADQPACVAALSDAEVSGRLAWTERMLGTAQRKARGWFWGWLAAHATIAGAGLALALVEEDPLRRDAFTIASITATASAVSMVSPPISSALLLRRFQRIPDGTLAERRAKLLRAGLMLQRAAGQEERGRAWYRHAFAVAFAGGEAFFLGVRHPGRPLASIISGAATLAMLELEVATTPRGAYRAYANYLYGNRPCMVPEMREVPLTAPEPELEFIPVAGGVGLQVRF